MLVKDDTYKLMTLTKVLIRQVIIISVLIVNLFPLSKDKYLFAFIICKNNYIYDVC